MTCNKFNLHWLLLLVLSPCVQAENYLCVPLQGVGLRDDVVVDYDVSKTRYLLREIEGRIEFTKMGGEHSAIPCTNYRYCSCQSFADNWCGTVFIDDDFSFSFFFTLSVDDRRIHSVMTGSCERLN